jgi:dodecin
MASTYKLVELVGVSDVGVDDAIKNAVARANETLKGLDWFEVTETRGVINDGRVTFQVTLKIGFRLMSDDELRGVWNSASRSRSRRA